MQKHPQFYQEYLQLMKDFRLRQELYERRFRSEHQQRNSMWKTLCASFFKRFISPTDTVLDVATGYGEFINNVCCQKKIATDINPASQRFINKDVRFLLGSSTKIPLKDASVDKIFVSNFFEHITREEILKTLQEFYRLLAPRGKILVLQPNFRFCYKDYWMFFDHITPVDDRGLTEACALAHLTQEYKIERFLPYTTKGTLPKSEFVIRLYLSLPLLWKLFGAQSFLIYRKKA